MATSAEILSLLAYVSASWPHIPTAAETAQVWVHQFERYPIEHLSEAVYRAVETSETWPSVRRVHELAEARWTNARQSEADRRLRLPEPKADPNDPRVRELINGLREQLRMDRPKPEEPEEPTE